MSLTEPTRADYDAAFERERARSFSEVDALECETGYAVDRDRLETAARVLACPVKANEPCWQHGRVIYSVYRKWAETSENPVVSVLDVGTAKGFSALCAVWAMLDAGKRASVTSLDVIDPRAKQRRNTIAELDGALTLAETVAPWKELESVAFLQSFSTTWLSLCRTPVHLAFLDGKHRYDVVRDEANALQNLQPRGGVIIFDDVQIPGVARVVTELRGYDVRYVVAKVDRSYAIARKL